MFDSCVEKDLFLKNHVLRPGSYCLCNELKCIKLAVLGIPMESASRNQTAQDIFKENKLSGEIDSQPDSQLTYCETFPDAVDIGK